MKTREGFVLPAVIFSLAIMGLLAVVSLRTANDEHRSSRALRESVAAQYAAEAGAKLILATVVAPPKTVLDTLVPWLAWGDSADLGWSTLPNRASYHAMFRRYDAGGAYKLFFLTMTGRGVGTWGGEQVIHYVLTPNGEFAIPMSAAAVGGGSLANARLDSAGFLGVSVSGLDTIPAQVGAACNNPLQDRAGITWRHTANVLKENGAVVAGTPPPIAADPTMTPTSPFEWGDFNYDSLVAWATITLTTDPPFVQPELAAGPSCDTSIWTNWGDPIDNTSPCFDYFPIIHYSGLATGLGLDIRGNTLPGTGIGQGILLVDNGRLRFRDNFEFHGLIIAREELRIENEVNLIGGVIIGGRLRVEDNSTIRTSTCAMNRAMASLAGKAGLLAPIGSRAWIASLR